MTVSKQAVDTTLGRDTTITYTVTVSNTGTSGAGSVVVSDTLPLSVTFVSSGTTNGSSYNPGSGVWQVGDVGGGSSISLRVVVTGSLSQGQTITNTAVLSESIPRTRTATITWGRPPSPRAYRLSTCRLFSRTAHDRPPTGECPNHNQKVRPTGKVDRTFWFNSFSVAGHPPYILYTSYIHPIYILYTSYIHPIYILYTSYIHPKYIPGEPVDIFHGVDSRCETQFATRDYK